MSQKITLELLPCDVSKGESLVLGKLNGGQIVFKDPEEASEFLALFFGMGKREIAVYWKLKGF